MWDDAESFMNAGSRVCSWNTDSKQRKMAPCLLSPVLTPLVCAPGPLRPTAFYPPSCSFSPSSFSLIPS